MTSDITHRPGQTTGSGGLQNITRSRRIGQATSLPRHRGSDIHRGRTISLTRLISFICLTRHPLHMAHTPSPPCISYGPFTLHFIRQMLHTHLLRQMHHAPHTAYVPCTLHHTHEHTPSTTNDDRRMSEDARGLARESRGGDQTSRESSELRE